MSKSMPPTPPANRSPKGPGADAPAPQKTGPDKKTEARERNLEQEGRQGNIKQNTTNQGYQQDR